MHYCILWLTYLDPIVTFITCKYLWPLTYSLYYVTLNGTLECICIIKYQLSRRPSAGLKATLYRRFNIFMFQSVTVLFLFYLIFIYLYSISPYFINFILFYFLQFYSISFVSTYHMFFYFSLFYSISSYLILFHVI